MTIKYTESSGIKILNATGYDKAYRAVNKVVETKQIFAPIPED